MKENVQRKGNIGVKRVTNRQKVNGQLSGSKKEADPSTKIKLQLFPIDEATRSRIVKDGLNPFLELTLKPRKKISSVIKHIHTKWGGSSIGKPMLLPYDAQLRPSIRWTSKDSSIRAGDVYTALQTPPTFRLCYGWFSDEESETGSERTHKATDRKCEADATTQVAVPAPHLEEEEEDANSKMKIDMNLRTGGNENNSFQAAADISIGGLVSEASLQGKLTWDDDNLTALSIGGLLAEASLQAKINNNEGDSVAVQRSNCSSSSILDAEETCHAFALRKFSSSSTRNSPQHFTSNAFRFPEVGGGAEPKLEVFPQHFMGGGEDSKSLGLRGITWNESLGPFDLGNSIPWKISGGSNL